ncbi:polyketide synthase dehydratase domain-containing protein [Phytohabitans flavus]|uniref:polyketide synthase dehydratase domain-containing protein n=1 Tax=Phytohabitans flavus TaxID=1076124 RepID=UPI00363B1674
MDLSAVAAACPRQLPVADHYRKLRALGLAYGPALTAIQEIRVGDGVLLARLRLPRSPSGMASTCIRPLWTAHYRHWVRSTARVTSSFRCRSRP